MGFVKGNIPTGEIGPVARPLIRIRPPFTDRGADGLDANALPRVSAEMVVLELTREVVMRGTERTAVPFT